MTKQEELLERLKKFTIYIISLTKQLPKTQENSVYINQIIRSSSSIGANYSEAICAHTKADFVHDLNKSRKEANETVYWLDLILEANKVLSGKILPAQQEAKEILKIFISSVKTTKLNIEKSSRPRSSNNR